EASWRVQSLRESRTPVLTHTVARVERVERDAPVERKRLAYLHRGKPLTRRARRFREQVPARELDVAVLFVTSFSSGDRHELTGPRDVPLERKGIRATDVTQDLARNVLHGGCDYQTDGGLLMSDAVIEQHALACSCGP